MTLATRPSPTHATGVPPLTRQETERLAFGELDAFLALVDQLEGSDWSQPTACTLWDVRDMVAHQGGHVESGMGLRGMMAQLSPKVRRPYTKRGMNALDGMNQAQVDMRRDWTIEQIVAEVREGTPKAIVARRSMPLPSRLARVPAPDYGLIRLDYLLHVIFPRDMWIHRLDIADATGRPFITTREHDGLMLEHVIRDTERNVRKLFPGHAINLTLEGPAGGSWLLGRGEEVAVTMSVPDFLRASSRRLSADQRLAASEVSARDPETRDRALDSLVAVY